MIIEFTVKNFRSIKNEQLFSLFAENKLKHHSGNISYIDNIGVLKTCAIYGSNAAGKTNIILAYKALQTLIAESGEWKDGDEISCYEPYLLSKDTVEQPVYFGIEFNIDNIRYLYEISFNKKEIIFEKLDAFYSKRSSNLFTRNSSHDWKGVKFGERYKDGKKQIAFFSNNTYLSKAGNTPDSPEIIRKIFNYFRKNTFIALSNQQIGISGWHQDDNINNVINTFLRKIDLGINHFKMEEKSLPENFELPSDMPEIVKNKLLYELSKEPSFNHETDYGEFVNFHYSKESMGTIKLFNMLPFFIKVLLKGATIFIDEIENSFHPHVAELLVKLFNDPMVNKNNAQLIFTTHDLTLMTSKTMRKDQIYLTKKNIQEGTSIECLENFDIKDNSPFQKWYDEGRLGSIPTINYRDISDSIKKLFDA